MDQEVDILQHYKNISSKLKKLVYTLFIFITKYNFETYSLELNGLTKKSRDAGTPGQRRDSTARRPGVPASY